MSDLLVEVLSVGDSDMRVWGAYLERCLGFDPRFPLGWGAL